MKIFIFALILFALPVMITGCAVATDAANSAGNSTGESLITDGELDSVLDNYFSARLSSDVYSSFGKELFFDTSKISSYREKTWNAWKTANANISEKKLPPLGNINIGDSYYVTSDEWVWDENHEYQYQPTVPRPEYIWTLPALSGEPQFDAWIYLWI